MPRLPTVFMRGLLLTTVLCLSQYLLGCTGGQSASGDSQDADPVVIDIPIAYIKRPLYEDRDGDPATAATRFRIDARRPTEFHGGASLWLRERADPSASERNITARLVGVAEGFSSALYDVRDLSASFDGQKLVFALRAPQLANVDEEDQPTWNIWEYNRSTDDLHRVISSDINAEAGHDLAPHYLADGRIVFASTRQRQAKAVLLDEGKPQFAHMDENRQQETLSLHVMDAAGSDIHQISFNQSHDSEPSVLSDGRIIYGRWDNHAFNRRGMHLYTMNPDGSSGDISRQYGNQNNQLMSTLLYGWNSHDSDFEDLQFLRPREMQDGRVLVLKRAFDSDQLGGDIIAIDTKAFSDAQTPIAGSTTANAETSLSATDVRLGQINNTDRFSPGGRYNAAWPLWDGSGRLLVSWSQCRLVENPNDPLTRKMVPCTAERIAVMTAAETGGPASNMIEADPYYGLYVFDVASRTQRPIALPANNEMFSDIVAMEARPLPLVRPDLGSDNPLVAEGVAVLHIRSVYDFNSVDAAPGGITTLRDPALTGAATRPVHFIRLEKAVSIPDDEVRDFDNSAFGFSGGVMREILGYVPVEPDGSAKFKIPANVALGFALLDIDGNAINSIGSNIVRRHNSWLTFRPGEQVNCNGCHSASAPAPGTVLPIHGRGDAENPSSNAGAVSNGVFANTDPQCDLDGNSCLNAQSGETMAEVRARVKGPRTPSLDLKFDDEWPAAALPRLTSFNWRLRDLPGAVPAPAASNCLFDWISLCRTTIHYPIHIQALWEANRPVLDGTGAEIADQRCTSCHNETTALSQPQVPAGHLQLTGEASTVAGLTDFAKSYAQLMATHDQLRLNATTGVLEPLTLPIAANRVAATIPAPPAPPLPSCPVGVPDPADINFCFVCPQGVQNATDPAICDVTQTVSAVLNAYNARGANRFFNLFRAGGSHENYLSGAELKLVREWLDIGAQYYNDPFIAPEN